MDTNQQNSVGNSSSSSNLEGIDLSQNIKSDVEEIPFKRDEKGRLLPGHKGGPGRPKGKTLKEYQADKFRNMSDDEREEFLKEITKDIRWRMAEGNPHTTTDTKLDGEINLKISKEIADKLESNEINTKPSDNSEGQD